MDGIINIDINGNTLKRDYNVAGVQGESNSTKLRITFGENWDGYAKTITFWDASGQNSVLVQLSTNLLENVLESWRTYLVPIPGEAMTESGENCFVVQGYADGKIKRTVEGNLKVLPSRWTDDAEEPIEPTPTQVEQIRAELDAVISDITEARQASTDAMQASERAEEARNAVENMTVTSTVLEPGKDATVEKQMVDDAVNFHFGIPASFSGVHYGTEPPTNDQIKVWIDTDGELDSGFLTEEEVDAKIAPVDEKIDTCFLDVEHLAGELHKKVTADDVLNLIPQSVDFNVLQGDVWHLDDLTTAMSVDIEGILQKMNEEAHFRGYLSTNAKVQALEATPNDFAYSAESGTKWVYDGNYGWQDTGASVPDQLTPASDATPLMNGTATAGQATEYARGDHRHPTDTTRVSVEEFNALKNDISAAFDELHAYAQALINGGAE